MTPQGVTIEEPINHLTDIVEAHGDIPTVVTSRVDGFQAYGYESRSDAPYAPARPTEVALIH